MIEQIDKLSKELGKKIDSVRTIYGKGFDEKNNEIDSFSAVNEAERLVKVEGFTKGSMAGDMPIGLVKKSKGIGYIAKWYNINREELKHLDGVLMSNDFRNGDVHIVVWKD